MQPLATVPLISWLAVAVGSAAGGLARYGCGLLIARIDSGFPWATLFVNVTGSFLIGVVAALTDPAGRWAATPLLRELLMVGVLGGYTTFSAFSLQTFSLLREGRVGFAIANVSASVALCLVVVWLGYLAGASFKSTSSF